MPAQDGDPEDLRARAADWFALLRSHACTDADRVAFDRWRAADPDHAKAYDRLVLRWEQTAFLAGSGVARSRDLEAAFHPDHRWRRAAIAAGIALLVTIGAGSIALRGHLPGTGSPPAGQIAAFTSPAHAMRVIRLADGSTVTLDRASELRVGLSGAERRLWLGRGRARFDVARDARRPFTVVAADGSVTAHGTVFDVNVSGDAVQVLLLRGSVDVTRHSGLSGAAAERVRLTPGQQVSYSAGSRLSPASPSRQEDTGWVPAMLSFDRTPLGDAIAAFNRRNRVKLALEDPSSAALQVSGAFRADDPTGFARAVASMFGLQTGRHRSGSIIIAASAP